MRTAIIVTNKDGGKSPVLQWFGDATEARKTFKEAEIKSGTMELWTSDSGRVKRKKFAEKSKPVVGKSFSEGLKEAALDQDKPETAEEPEENADSDEKDTKPAKSTAKSAAKKAAKDADKS